MNYVKALFLMLLVVLIPSISIAADSNTVSSTVVTDKAPPTASAPSIVINNSDVCKSAYSVAGQTGFFGLATGITITNAVNTSTVASTVAENDGSTKIATTAYADRVGTTQSSLTLAMAVALG